MSEVYDLVGGGFAHMTAPFGVHPLDRRRAAEYLVAALKANISWADAENDIRTYLASQNYAASEIDEEVARAAELLKPWLR